MDKKISSAAFVDYNLITLHFECLIRQINKPQQNNTKVSNAFNLSSIKRN